MFFRIFERAYIIVLLLCSMQVVTGLTNQPATQIDPEVVSAGLNMPSVAIEASVYLFGALLVLMRWRRVLRAARTVCPLVALAALALLSILWSVEPTLTLRRSSLLLASTVLAIYLGERYSLEELARIVAHTLCLMIIVVVVLYFVAPSYVIDHSIHMGAWTGISVYKNVFGEYMADAVLLLCLVRFRHLSWLRYVFLFAAAVLLVLSHSATALVCCALAVVAMPLWRLTGADGGQRIAAYAMSALMSFLGIFFLKHNTDVVFQILGRDPTLTGRTRLWAALLPAIVRHPILGYGYDAFWTGLKGEALNVWIGSGWLAPRADNGYFDLCLSLGAVGVCIFTYLLVNSVRMAADYVRSEPRPIGLWPITYLCFFAVHNICESTLLTRGTLPFLMFAALTTSLALRRRRAMTTTRTTHTQVLMDDWGPRVLSDSHLV